MTVDEKTAVEAETTTGAFLGNKNDFTEPESERKYSAGCCKRLPAL